MNDPDLLREQVRAWLDAHFDPGVPLRSWLELLADSGWGAPAWPAAWYGQGLPADLAAVAIAEFGAAGVPGPPAGLGSLLAAPTIIAHGSDELKRKYVRAVLTGEHAWCQLFSEPGAGSDLASLATRAERDDEDFVIDGQKVWTSGAQVADYGLLLARTNVNVPKHRGITCFALRMDQPGVEVRPLRQMTGDAMFSEVFLTGARVSAADIIGELDAGWGVALTTLAHERTGLGARAGTGFAVTAPGGSRFRAEREVPAGDTSPRCAAARPAGPALAPAGWRCSASARHH